MRILDVFCCAGGAGTGYHRAGFDVYGVDIAPQPNYPFAFCRGDALAILRYLIAGVKVGFTKRDGSKEWLGLDDFDAVHTSPPCQSRTTMSNRYPEAQAAHPQLIAPTRDLLEEIGLPYVIENVPGARRDLLEPTTLAGGMFQLHVDRPRLFETNFPLTAPPKRKPDHVIGVYGRSHDGRRLWTRADGSVLRAARTLEEGRKAMGIEWMAWHELTEAIPPAYTEFIGGQLIAHLTRVAA